MVKLNIIFKYIARYTALFSATFLLSGCLGGTVAQQIVRSIATSVADKAMARALDVDEDQPYSNRRHNDSYAQTSNSSVAPSNSVLQPSQAAHTQAQTNQPLTKQNLHETQPSALQLALANTAFNEVNAQEIKPITEPLPVESIDTEKSTVAIQSSQLVRVELFNMLIGEEKNAVYESARIIGASNLPQKREWALWQVATGAIQSNHNQPDKKLITFLIPPEFGKLPSGAVTMVELASPGELNVARYKGN
jgi:hypothetical protein